MVPSLRFLLVITIFLAVSVGVYHLISWSNQTRNVFADSQEASDHIDPDVPVYWKQLSDYHTNDFAIDPFNPANIYIATGYPTEVAYSRDFGSTWITKTLSSFVDGQSIAIDPVAPNNVYLSFYPTPGIYRSQDSGETWTRVDNGTIITQTYVSELFVHPITPSLLLGGSGVGNPYIYRSDDYGDSWTSIPLIITPTNNMVLQILSHPTMPQKIYALVSDQEVFISEDAGLTWAISGWRAEALAIDSSNPQIMYKLECYPFRTANGGATWEQLNPPQPCYQDLHIDPADSNIIYVTGQSRLPTRSVDAGQNWQILGGQYLSGPESSAFAIDPVDTTRLYTGYDVYVSVYLDETISLPIIVR